MFVKYKNISVCTLMHCVCPYKAHLAKGRIFKKFNLLNSFQKWKQLSAAASTAVFLSSVEKLSILAPGYTVNMASLTWMVSVNSDFLAFRVLLYIWHYCLTHIISIDLIFMSTRIGGLIQNSILGTIMQSKQQTKFSKLVVNCRNHWVF